MHDLDATSWDELTAAAREFSRYPLGHTWDELDRAALRRAIARLKMTGERAKSYADVLLLLEQLCDEPVGGD